MRDSFVPLGSTEQQLATAVLMSLGGFIAQVSALWELADICEESVRPREGAGDEARLRDGIEGSLAGLAPDTRERVARAGMEWVDALTKLSQTELGVAFGFPHGGVEASSAAERAQIALGDLLSAYPDMASASTFTLGFLDLLTGVSRVEVMYESIVTAAVSAFHTQLRTVATTIEHERRPTLGEAQLAAVIERLVSGGPPRWRDWLLQTLECDLPTSGGDLALVSEVFARRNLFVHHGGAVSTRYVHAVPNAPPLSMRLTADATYTRLALREISLVGVQLALTAWKAFRPSFRSSAESLALFLTQRYALPVHAWALVRVIGDDLMTRAAEQREREFARVLGALAAKRAGDGDAVQELCAAWIPSGADFGLIRHVLLGEMDEAFATATQLVDAGVLSRFDLESWPALADLQGDSRWPELRDRAR